MGDIFTQGSIVQYIRSAKYPNIKCEGIVISARCDLAQEKINQFHCLSAMNIEEWIYEVLFENVVNELNNSLMGTIKKYCEQKKMDYDILCTMDEENFKRILLRSASSNEQKNMKKNIEEKENILRLFQKEISRKEKKDFLKKNRKLVENKLKALYNSAFPKFAFIPEKAYSTGKSSVGGLVIDLQDVIQLDIKVKEPILKYEYDYRIVKDEKKREYINTNFFFESDSDFVIAETVIKSPWIEYILQMFANSFMRIGVDNALDYEIQDFCTKILGENK